MKDERVIEAHSHCIRNENMLSKDSLCGCFHCIRIFSPGEIKEWINDKNGKTARCPHCGVDSVIGESSGYPITEEFLKQMKDHWFDRPII